MTKQISLTIADGDLPAFFTALSGMVVSDVIVTTTADVDPPLTVLAKPKPSAPLSVRINYRTARVTLGIFARAGLGAELSIDQVGEGMTAQGYAAKSASGACSNLNAAGLLRRVRPKVYVLTDAGAAYHAKDPRAA
jgi:hypothetical protein